jgi:hypothetical protein
VRVKVGKLPELFETEPTENEIVLSLAAKPPGAVTVPMANVKLLNVKVVG